MGTSPAALGGSGLRFVRLKRPLLAAAAGLLFVDLYLSLLWVPSLTLGFSAPVAQRIFYFHLGAAITSYAAFAVNFAASIQVLRTGRPAFDTLARDAAGLALLFVAQALIAGSLWGWAEWGVAWRFEDARLDTYLVLALVFVGYFAARRQLRSAEGREATAAAYAVVGFVLVPLSYLSIYFWQSLHPRVISPGGQGIGPEGGMAVGLSVVGFLLLFLALLAWRTDLSRLEAQVASLQQGAEG